MKKTKKGSEPTLAMVMQEEIDRERELASADGLATRPVESLTVTKKFAPLREHAWQLVLAIELVWFARSSDETSQQWPLEKLDLKLRRGQAPIPTDLTIAQGVVQVLTVLEQCDPKWFARNIVEPIARRAIDGSWVPADFSDGGDDAEHQLAAGMGGYAESTLSDLQTVTLAADLAAIAATHISISEELEMALQSDSPQPDSGAYRVAVECGIIQLARLARSELLGTPAPGDVDAPVDANDVDLVREVARVAAPALATGKYGARFRQDIAEGLRERLHRG